VEPPYPGEERLLVPSQKVATYDLMPEMSAPGVTDVLCRAIEAGHHDFILCNYANGDMVGHSGVLSAAVRAVECVDRCLERVLKSAARRRATLLITADHGNCELMIDPATDGPHTAHTTNPVPFLIVDDHVPGPLRHGGALCDVGPTVLRLLGIEPPPVMPAVRLAAQVGHDPAHSPYRDVPRGGATVASFGYLGGSRGDVGVGKADGATAGVRYEAALGRVIGVSFGLAYALTTRFVVDPAKDSLSRKSGPVDDGTILVDAGLQLNLTGQKSWHGLAPYLGGALGMAFSPARVAADTSGYTFGTKITLAPDAGLRWY